MTSKAHDTTRIRKDMKPGSRLPSNKPGSRLPSNKPGSRLPSNPSRQECIKVAGGRQAYARGHAMTTRGIRKPIRIMIDSGNITTSGVAVSEKFMMKMQLGYSRIG